MWIVVFDLDETLGYFTQFGIFWDCLKQFLSANKNEMKLEFQFILFFIEFDNKIYVNRKNINNLENN